MPNLDGKDKIVPVPFDAHEQATRGEHIPTTTDSPDKDPATIVEFPKAVDHVDHPSGVGQEPVLVNTAEEEAAHLDAKDEAADSAVESEPSTDKELIEALLSARKRISQLDAAVDQGSDALFTKDAEIAALNKRIADLEAKLATPKPDAQL